MLADGIVHEVATAMAALHARSPYTQNPPEARPSGISAVLHHSNSSTLIYHTRKSSLKSVPSLQDVLVLCRR